MTLNTLIPMAHIVVALCFVGVSACGEPAETQNAIVVKAPSAIRITAERQDLVFRYLSPAGDKVLTATKVDDIPLASRATVLVFTESVTSQPGWEHVADLSQPLPVSAEPKQGYVLRLVRPTPKQTQGAGTAKQDRKATVTTAGQAVNMFSTQGCAYCTKARRFFQANRVGFSEYDLERDREAKGKLNALAQASGVSAGQLQGVPIIFVGRQVIRGFNESRLRSLLGI